MPQHAVGLWSPLIQLGHLMNTQFFCSVERKVQVGTEDLESDAQLIFAPVCSLEAHLSLAAQRCSQVSAVWMVPLSCFSVQLTSQQYNP